MGLSFLDRYREMTWAALRQTVIDSAKAISQILILVSAVGAYSWLVTQLVEFI